MPEGTGRIDAELIEVRYRLSRRDAKKTKKQLGEADG